MNNTENTQQNTIAKVQESKKHCRLFLSHILNLYKNFAPFFIQENENLKIYYIFANALKKRTKV